METQRSRERGGPAEGEGDPPPTRTPPPALQDSAGRHLCHGSQESMWGGPGQARGEHGQMGESSSIRRRRCLPTRQDLAPPGAVPVGTDLGHLEEATAHGKPSRKARTAGAEGRRSSQGSVRCRTQRSREPRKVTCISQLSGTAWRTPRLQSGEGDSQGRGHEHCWEARWPAAGTLGQQWEERSPQRPGDSVSPAAARWMRSW